MVKHHTRFQNVQCVKKIDILVEQHSLKEFFICDHAVLEINKVALFLTCEICQSPVRALSRNAPPSTTSIAAQNLLKTQVGVQEMMPCPAWGSPR